MGEPYEKPIGRILISKDGGFYFLFDCRRGAASFLDIGMKSFEKIVY